MNRLTFLIWISVIVTLGQGLVWAQQPPAFSPPGVPPSPPTGIPPFPSGIPPSPPAGFPPPQFAPVPAVPGQPGGLPSINRFLLPKILSEKILLFILRGRVLLSNCQKFPVSRKRRQGLSNWRSGRQYSARHDSAVYGVDHLEAGHRSSPNGNQFQQRGASYERGDHPGRGESSVHARRRHQ